MLLAAIRATVNLTFTLELNSYCHFNHDAPGLARPPVSLKGIRPGRVILSQGTALEFFDNVGTVGKLESHLIVEIPFVSSVRVKSQQNAAVRDFCFRWAALELQCEGVGRILVPAAFIAFGLADFMPVSVLEVNIQF